MNLYRIQLRLAPVPAVVFGALHEFAGGGAGTADGAAAALMVVGIAARTKGKILWCLSRPDLIVMDRTDELWQGRRRYRQADAFVSPKETS